ncbi:TPA: hypothetical protein JAJ28_000118 [Aeromonas hydrophila]|uniref:Uncharacterized protein n=1 Tax=Aeromonas hydrophila TaxID=644 RepID=A0AAD3U728_AERHY|nr:hypothetical protein [Aeromonas hydrophila]
MQCVQTLADGTLQVVALAEGETCTTGLFLVQAADNAWAALLLDPAPYTADIAMALGAGMSLPLMGYIIGWSYGVVLSMFRHQ